MIFELYKLKVLEMNFDFFFHFRRRKITMLIMNPLRKSKIVLLIYVQKLRSLYKTRRRQNDHKLYCSHNLPSNHHFGHYTSSAPHIDGIIIMFESYKYLEIESENIRMSELEKQFVKDIKINIISYIIVTTTQRNGSKFAVGLE